MKTITEFSGVLLQRAAEAQRAFRAANPQVAASAAEDAPPSPEATEPAAGDAEAVAAAEPPAEAAEVPDGADEAVASEAAPA
jgi:hypothetical protein